MSGRRIIRGVVWLIATLFAVRQLSLAYHHYADWRLAVNDPSAREAYATFMEVELAIGMVIILLAIGVDWMLRRSGPVASASRWLSR